MSTYRIPALAAPDEVLPRGPFRPGFPSAPAHGETERLRQAGLLRRVLADVHVPGDLPDSPALRAAALALLVPSSAVAAGPAAAWVHSSGTSRSPEVLDLYDLPPHRRGPDLGTLPQRLRCGRLAPHEICRIGPLRLTTAERTALDLLCWSPPRYALEALLVLARDTGLDAGRTRLALERRADRRGVVAARRVLAVWAALDADADAVAGQNPNRHRNVPQIAAEARPGSRG